MAAGALTIGMLSGWSGPGASRITREATQPAAARAAQTARAGAGAPGSGRSLELGPQAGEVGKPGHRPFASSADCGPTNGAGQAPWPTFGGNLARSGDGVGVPHAAGKLHQKWETQLDGAIYGQPLVAGGCLYVATENDTVYALDATTGVLRWRTHLASPVTSGLACAGDIDPSGITGTPALDAAAGTLWAVILTDVNGTAAHQVVELDASNGQLLRRQAIAMPGRDPTAEQERGALAISGGNVYIPFGGLYGDCGNYVGGVVSVPEAAGHVPGYWEVPTAREGGMWEPGGPDVLPDGNLLIADGNGAAGPGQPFDKSDAVIELSPGLKLIGYFAPTDWVQLNQSDGDLDSTGPAVLPHGMALEIGKAGVAYLVDTSHLGGVGGEVASVQVCGGGAYGADAVSGGTVYIPCGSGMQAVRASGRSLHVLWHSSGGSIGSPVVAGARVWEETNSGTLQGFNPATGQVVQTFNFPNPVTHFPWVVAVGSTLYAPDGMGVVALGGL